MASLGKSSLAFAAATLLSRVLGLLRDVLIARYFAAGVSDPFFAALRIPNTLRRFFAEGSFANAFVPVFAATRAEQPEKLRDLLRHVSGTLLVILLVVTLCGVLGSSWIIYAVARGLVDKPGQLFLAEHMLRIMFPYLPLISLTALAGGVLNAHGRFALPALTPVFLNLALIVACLLHSFPGRPVGEMGLAWAVLIGGIVQLAIQLPFLYRLGMLVKPKWGFRHPGVRRILALMVPTLFGSSIGQLSILVNTFLASTLTTGSISWLYYADRMVELPIALVGVALGTVILPRLSALKADDDKHRFRHTLDWALDWALVVGSAASTGLVILAAPILATLFHGGHFDAHDVMMTTYSLRAYAVAAVFLIMVKVLVSAFYARHDTRTPVFAGVLSMTANIVFAITLSRFFGHVGLAAASSVAAGVNVVLLLFFLFRAGIPVKALAPVFLGKILLANMLMAAFLVHFSGDIGRWLIWNRWERAWHLCGIIVVAMLVYAAVLFALGVRWECLAKARQ